ncbi:MAG: uridine kinase [Bdellovibrio sp.]
MNKNRPFIIALAGGSGCGKTTLARIIEQKFGEEHVEIIGQDHYYHDWEILKDREDVNFDHPESLDFDLLREHLLELREGNSVDTPLYDFCTNSRSLQTEKKFAKSIIIVDGTLILSRERLRDLFDYKVFIDIPEEVRFSRRLSRDVAERGRTEESVRNQFFNQVAPMHKVFVDSSKKFANFCICLDKLEHQFKELISLLEAEIFRLKGSGAQNTFSIV